MRYPSEFEKWYRTWLKDNASEADEKIIRARDRGEVESLAEGERWLRKILYIQWLIESGKIKCKIK